MMLSRAAGKATRAASAAFVVLLLAARGAMAIKLTGASEMMPRTGEGAGGELLASATIKLNNVVGDAAVAQFAGGGFKMQAGLAEMEAQPGSVVSITGVTKATDTLTLAWTAPGLDGSQGDPTSAFWRIDYSSDASHVFAPTTYKLEIPTSTTVGAAQSYQLTGLLPNTTYYAKIYLADATKYFADDSAKSGDSTLANAPVNPFFSQVSPTNVTISWLLPAGGAEGYNGVSSLTNFGGVVSSSSTPNGTLLSLTLNGLSSNTTYFFKVASLNWQGDKTYSVVLSTLTPTTVAPLPVTNLAAMGSGLARTAQVTWNNPSYTGFSSVIVALSTSPFAPPIVNGQDYLPGQVLSDSSVIKSTGVSVAWNQTLTLDSTYYYHVFTEGASKTYSVDVSTSIFLDIPPMAAAGMTAQADPARTALTIRWTPVQSNLDGSLFAAPGAPKPFELDRYELYRSTGIVHPTWVLISTYAASASMAVAPIPNPVPTYYYKVAAVDSFGTSDAAMAVDTDGNLYALNADGVTRLEIPAAITKELTAANSKTGTDILVRASDAAGDANQGIFRAVNFGSVQSPSNADIGMLQLSKPALVSLHYDVVGGMVSTSPTTSAGVSDVTATNAPERLAMYWDNNAKYIKLYGDVDPLTQSVTVQSGFGGSYQIRSLVRAQDFSFDISQVSNRAITPNGDGRNDTAVFWGENPHGADVSGEIFDIRGAHIADMVPAPLVPHTNTQWTLMWDGKSGGTVVRGGVYIYQIKAEGKAFTGTVVVIR